MFLDSNPLLRVSFVNIFSHLVGAPFILLMVVSYFLSKFSPSLVSTLVTIFLNSSGKLLISVFLGFFIFPWGIFLVPSFERYSFVFSFCLNFYFYSHELDKVAVPPSLGKVA